MGLTPGFCDFCLRQIDDPPYYVHLTDRFFVPGSGEAPAFVDTDGEWMACPACHLLVQKRDRKQLIDAWAHPGHRPSKEEKQYHQRIIDGFLANYHGSFLATDA